MMDTAFSFAESPLPMMVSFEEAAPATMISLPPSDMLEDVQGRGDDREIALQSAGVSRVNMPLNISEKAGGTQTVAAMVSMAVGLPPHEKGTHMSRFIEQLAQWSESNTVSLNALPRFTQELSDRLHATSTDAEFAFTYFLPKAAPVTNHSAPMGYPVRFTVSSKDQNVMRHLHVQVPISTLCPCSKSISDFGAHNQRAVVDVSIALNTNVAEESALWIEDVVEMIDTAASCPVYPLLKRMDEKWVTERQYMNPKFVEDVARDLVLVLRKDVRCAGFSVRVEALESIHAHNAWAAHSEGMDG